MAFFFTLLFMFLVFWRPQEWLVPELYGVPMLDIVVGAASVAFLAEMDQRRIRIFRSPVPWLLAGLFFAALMSHIAHTYFAGMMWTLQDTWKICFFGILLFCVADRLSRLRTIAILFVAMACVMSVHALLQKYRGYGFGGQGPMMALRAGNEEPIVRSLFFGIFEDPNDLAQILVTSMPFAFVLTKRAGIISFLLGTGITVLLLFAVLATRSRGGMIALAGVAASMLVLMLPARWIPYVMLLPALGALALCPYSGTYLDQSGHDRVVFWGEANWLFKNNPLFGVGYRMFPESISGNRAAHNAFVYCYTEIGVFGYWFWFNLISLGVIGCWRARVALRNSVSPEGRYLHRFSGVAVAAMVGFLASGYFLSRTYVYPLFFLFVILNAVPLVAERLLPEGHPRVLPSRRDMFLYGTVGVLASIFYIYVSIVLLNKAFYV